MGLGLLAALSFTACKKKIAEPTCVATDPGTVTDIDGNIYETVVLGNQEWMTENLRVSSYSNGDPIPNVTDDAEWAALTTGATCWFDNDQQYEDPYGKLYNWYAVNDTRNICPTGWHVPTDAEWMELETFLGMDSLEVDSFGFLYRGLAENIGGKMREVGTTYWMAPNDSATNESCFSGLPGGGRYFNGSFTNLGRYGGWWTATAKNVNSSWYRSLSNDNGSLSRSSYKFAHGVSVRCIKD